MACSQPLAVVLVLAITLLLLLSHGNAGLAVAEAKPAATLLASPAANADVTAIAPLSLTGERRAAFAAFVANALASCGAPGASVAVVQDGSVVFLEGFGLRELGRPQPVTPDTLLGVGSVTKSFTATLAATLVDGGRVRWNTPVRELLPDFALSEPERSERITLADLLSGASGLPRRDLELVFEADAYTPDGMLAAVSELPLTAPPGERFQYSNQAFTIGGYAVAAANGAAPDDLPRGYTLAVQDHLLNPVGMERSTFDLETVKRSGNYAAPHASALSGQLTPIPLQVEERFTRAVAPAGALWSTARDMAFYLQMQLAHGVAADGTRVVSAENLARTWQPGVAVPPSPDLPPVVSKGLAKYGLGWYVGSYGGRELISHSGGTYGFSSEIAFMPDAGLGVAVLANDVICGSLVGFAAQYRLFELVFAQEAAVEAEFTRFLEALTSQRDSIVDLLRPIDPAAMEPYTGLYVNPALGEIQFRLEGDQFLFDAGEVGSHLQPLPAFPGFPAQFFLTDPPLNGAPAFFTFTVVDGAPRPALTLRGANGDPPIVYPFSRVPG